MRAHHTLALLTLKPGMFTAQGRDACGEIWLNTLGLAPQAMASLPQAHAPVAQLLLGSTPVARPHASHKGSYGDLAVIGGAPTMAGAAILAARAALHGGAGRVLVGMLQEAAPAFDPGCPELMFRNPSGLEVSAMTVVAGFGAAAAIAAHLPRLLEQAPRLVLDADALNAIAASAELQAGLVRRASGSTVLTPHPLEAARLLGQDAARVQADRPAALRGLVDRFGCTVVLKGSGTMIGSPGQLAVINSSGNARLASAGTGDVLAGLLGALWAGGASAHDAACDAVYRHGRAADLWPGTVLHASALCALL